MKKLLKIIGIGLLAIVVLIGLGLLYIGMSDIPSYEVATIDYQVESTPESIERGKKLATMLCANCHMNKETRSLTGVRMLDAPPEFGDIYSANITQDKTYCIGEWTDGELVYLLRTGIKRDGQYSPPYMAKLPTIADEDINAIIAFLRSDDPMVAAKAVPDTPSNPSLLTKVLCRVAFKPFPMPTAKIELPNSTNTVALGKYLAHNLDCFSCHSADFKTNDFLNPELSKGYFGGGNKPLDLEGRVMLTSNLTPDKETGIGNWTQNDFIRAVKYGLKDGEHALSYPMTPYTQLTDNEAAAIFDYLQTIPPIHNKVERSVYE
ncbi:cytochrome c [Hanstruepera neustonica]|uniref:Cytochrome c n=1 Tax=Hanstruepera neustonica TaxID=1445657 RepID=A0A2K1E010_9FLAO|nr:c-type cytochrome [Hanstruepera neustonica]PNQ73630.1 cytochrome c [Hanstruepera neustonica]